MGAKLVLPDRGDLVSETFTTDDVWNLIDVKVFRPDRVIRDAHRTLDIKTGYANSAIELVQAKNYKRLREASIRNKKLQARLGGAIVGHDYLFLQGADRSKTSREVAAKEYERLADADLIDDTRMFYQADDGMIYLYSPSGRPSQGFATIHEALGLKKKQ